jgi:hypothetical protein
MADGNSLPGYSFSDLCRAAAHTKFAQRRAVGSELVGHDGGWSDALLLQEFSHQLERMLWLSIIATICGFSSRKCSGSLAVATLSRLGHFCCGAQPHHSNGQFREASRSASRAHAAFPDTSSANHGFGIAKLLNSSPTSRN